MVVGKFLAEIDTSVGKHCQCKGPEGKLKNYSSMDHLSLITKKQSDIRCASWHNTMVNWCQLQEMYQNGTYGKTKTQQFTMIYRATIWAQLFYKQRLISFNHP